LIPNVGLFRALLGALFLVDLLCYLPYVRVCLGPVYWGKSWPRNDLALAAVVILWALGAISLLTATLPLVGTGVLLLLFRHYYVANRWKNLFRGGGAPGFMSHFAVLHLLSFELATAFDPTGSLATLALVVFSVDLGAILVDSGTYKLLSGYLRSEGMEYGLANPMWGYWFRVFRRLSPEGLVLKAQDAGAAIAQVAMGATMIVYPLRGIGALICMASFLYLIPLVRLGRLAALMVVLPLPLLPELPIALSGAPELPTATAPGWPAQLQAVALLVYLVLLPAVKAMQYLNLFLRRPFPAAFQRWLTAYSNAIPIIMWRVFTPDVTNFFIRIYAIAPSGEERAVLTETGIYAYRDLGRWQRASRFLHVTESIALTTVFTTLKYFPSRRELFDERLVAYASSLGLDGTSAVRFEYVAIKKTPSEMRYDAVGEFVVDLSTRTVRERKIDPTFDYSRPARFSHIRETTGFGSYLPRV
jgi:hypothetical protein